MCSMSQKRRSLKPQRGDQKKLRRSQVAAADAFDCWLDDALRLKESCQFHSFEHLLLDRYDSHEATVDDRARCAYELALLYCQQGLLAAADVLLRELGFTYRLGKNIWNYRSAVKSGSVTSAIACYDNVLPPCLLSGLLSAFSLSSQFWTEHGYPTDSFFSYNTRLPIGKEEMASNADKKKRKTIKGVSKRESHCDNLMSQLAVFLRPLVAASFPDKHIDDIRSIEWWAHTRPNGPAAGHRFHYDMDESRLKTTAGAAAVADASIHPMVSSVLYLDDGGSSGAPTVVIDQNLSGECRDKAWLCKPKTARLLLFDGSLLHGVAPHISDSGASPGTRLTLLIGWWGAQVVTIPQSSQLGPNMIMPAAISGLQWPALFRALPTAEMRALDCRKYAKSSIDAIITIENGVWECIVEDSKNDGGNKSAVAGPTTSGDRRKKESNSLPPIYDSDVLFVGNWFLRSKGEINDEILKSSRGAVGTGASSVKSVTSSDLNFMSLDDLKRLRGEN